MEKQDSRSISSFERTAMRKTAVRLLKKGMKRKEVAEVLGVRPNTITEWSKRYRQNGAKGFGENKRGVSSEDKKLLTQDQEQQIQNLITDTMPDQLKLDFALWTRKAVKEVVEQEFGIKLGLTTMGDYLRKWGFTPQKPKKRAYEQCSKKVQNWLDEQYPTIKERAKQVALRQPLHGSNRHMRRLRLR